MFDVLNNTWCRCGVIVGVVVGVIGVVVDGFNNMFNALEALMFRNRSVTLVCGWWTSLEAPPLDEVVEVEWFLPPTEAPAEEEEG